MFQNFRIPLSFKELQQTEKSEDLNAKDDCDEKTSARSRTQTIVKDSKDLSQMGFDVDSIIGKGFNGQVFGGVCNANATKLYQLDKETDLDSINVQNIWRFTKCEIDRNSICEKTNECNGCELYFCFEEKSLEGKKMAVKYIDLSKPKHRKRTYRLSSVYSQPFDPLEEAKILMSLRHKNVVEVYNILTIDKNRLYIVMEMMEMPLSLWIKYLNRSEKKFNDQEIEYLLTETIEGLAYLHNNKVIHNDIHLANILVNTDSQKIITVKYADFGFSENFMDFNAPEYDIKDLGRIFKTILDLVQFVYKDYGRDFKNFITIICNGYFHTSQELLTELKSLKRF